MPKPSTTERIITAALSLIADRGLGSVTMVDVARSAGVARQTLYNHYTDVDCIVADVITHHNQESISQLRSVVAVADTATAKIEQLVLHIARISTHHGHTIDFEHSLAPEHRATLVDYNQALDDLITEIITGGQEQGEFRSSLDPVTDSTVIRYALTGISNVVNTNPDDVASARWPPTPVGVWLVGRPRSADIDELQDGSVGVLEADDAASGLAWPLDRCRFRDQLDARGA